MRRRRRKQAGFTLIELMVSLVLFSFAIAGVLAIAVSMAQGYREQRQVVETETAARGALDFIADALRMASPGVSAATYRSVTSGVLIIDPSDTAKVEDTTTASGACVTGTVRVQNNAGLNNSDILDVVFASGPVVTTLMSDWTVSTTSIDVTDTSSFAKGDAILITDGADGRIVRIEDITDADTLALEPAGCTRTAPANADAKYARGALVLRVLRARFFLFNNTTDGISTALYMDPDADGDLDPEPLADWIEDFQVAVGIDADDDGALADDEWYGGPATAAVFDPDDKLRAVRISLVARTASNLVATTATYQRPVVEDHTPTTALDTFRRRVLSTTVEIRNLGVSP